MGSSGVVVEVVVEGVEPPATTAAVAGTGCTVGGACCTLTAASSCGPIAEEWWASWLMSVPAEFGVELVVQCL
jgi:hypothetical protein